MKGTVTNSDLLLETTICFEKHEEEGRKQAGEEVDDKFFRPLHLLACSGMENSSIVITFFCRQHGSNDTWSSSMFFLCPILRRSFEGFC